MSRTKTPPKWQRKEFKTISGYSDTMQALKDHIDERRATEGRVVQAQVIDEIIFKAVPSIKRRVTALRKGTNRGQQPIDIELPE